jgi:hypothetical protein
MPIDFLASIESTLKARSLWSAVMQERLEEFNRLCLSEIKDQSLLEIVIAFLVEKVPVDFYVEPASKSGKNHPSWQNNVGGILLNTAECCTGIDRKMRIYPELIDAAGKPLSNERDIIYVATILSDTFKPEDFGKQWSEWNHHQRAAEEFASYALSHGLDASWVDPIRDAIFWHLGRFTPKREKDMLNPRVTLAQTSFITHELDMDFSNRSLEEVFTRKGAASEEKLPELPSTFVQQELTNTTTYFSQVETKMVSLVTLYATLVVAVVPGAAYVFTNEVIQQLKIPFASSVKALALGIFLVLFSLITTFLLAVYTELRVRKIAMLEAMAAARAYLMDESSKLGKDLTTAIITVIGVQKCPKFLRRPSEDWYMLCLMSALGGLFWACSLFSLGDGLLPAGLKAGLCIKIWSCLLAVLAFLVITFWHLSWVVRFCHEMDLRRATKWGTPKYDYMIGKRSTIPVILRPLDMLCRWIESKHAQTYET